MEPKIRLKGFSGEWKTSVIEEVATFSKGRGYSKSDLRPEGNPIILYGRLYTNYSSVIDSVDTFASLQNGSVLSKGNEVIIPGSGETPEDIAVASAVEQKGVILGGDLNVVTFNQEKIVPAFAAMSITNSKTHYELSGYAQGKTVVHLHNSSISKGHLSYPSIEEQNAIVSYVSSIDSLIQSTTKKIESLKQVKAASLQSMFPKEGETTPRVRFKGFEGDWEKVSLKKYAKRINRKNKNMESTLALTISSIEGLVSQIDYFNNLVVGANLANYYLLKNGEFAYNKSYSRGYPFGSVKRLDRYDQGILSTLYIVFSVNDEISSDYLARFFDTTLWHKPVAERAEEGARNHGLLNIGADDFMTIDIVVPTSRNEQQQIADFFTNLDSQITLQTQRLEKLKQIKSACLDNMFV